MTRQIEKQFILIVTIGRRFFSPSSPPLTIQARGLNNLVSRTTVCRGGGKMRRKGWKLRDKTRSGGVFFTRGGSTLSSKIMRCVSSGPWKSEPKGKKKNTRRTRVTNHLDPLEYTFYSSFLFHVPRSLTMVFRYRLEFLLFFFVNKNLHYFIFDLASNNVFNQPEKIFFARW